VVTAVTRARFESALGRSGGTVTRFLEELVGEPVDARDRRHETTTAGPANALDVDEGHPVLLRAAVLQGRHSARRYVRARSVVVPSRLSPTFCRRLETTTEPIGRLLIGEGLRFTRSALSTPLDRTASRSGRRPVSEDMLSVRRYRLDVEGVPVMVVSEWFLPVLGTFLPDASPSPPTIGG
jgi:chorismate-pyruvate lyase